MFNHQWTNGSMMLIDDACVQQPSNLKFVQWGYLIGATRKCFKMHTISMQQATQNTRRPDALYIYHILTQECHS
jgi:hypothetical protein